MNALSAIPKSRLVIIGVAVLLIVLIIVIANIPKTITDDPNLPSAASLVVWGLAEDQVAFNDLIKSYTASSKQLSKYAITFVPFSDGDELEKNVLNALAENTGPDIFYFHSSWTQKHKGKTQPAPSALVTAANISSYFPQVITQDFVDTTQNGPAIYALPLHMDVLGLLYNRDILEASGSTFDTATWNNLAWTDFTHIVQITKRLQGSAITRAGTALGTAHNVEHASDILSALLLQSQTPFITSEGRVSFDDNAKNAFLFYQQFANQASDNYTWNDFKGNSRQEFAAGNTATIIDYHAALADIRKKNQFIDMELVPLPQLSADASIKRTYAAYWGLAVSNFSRQKYAAWHFVRFATMNAGANSAYLETTGKLPALTSLINQKISQNQYPAYMQSFYYARSWRQKDPALTDAIFKQLIDNINTNRLPLDQAVKSAQDALNQ